MAGGRIEARLRELGIALPEPAAPLANYVPYTVEGGLVVVSGQIPLREGRVAYTGKLGGAVSVEDGEAAARLCFVNVLAQITAVHIFHEQISDSVLPMQPIYVNNVLMLQLFCNPDLPLQVLRTFAVFQKMLWQYLDGNAASVFLFPRKIDPSHPSFCQGSDYFKISDFLFYWHPKSLCAFY